MMNWFITCLVVLFFGLAILLGQCCAVVYVTIDDTLTEHHRANLLVLYNIKE